MSAIVAAAAAADPRADSPEPMRGPRPVPPAPPAPSLANQIALGLAIFAAVLAAAVPLALVSEGLGLAGAVGVGSVLIAVLARRLRIALMIATLLAVLGAFAAAHSVHLALESPIHPIRLPALSPASGETQAEGAVVMPVQIGFGATRMPAAGWAFPGALFALWAIGFALIRANHAFARWLWRRAGLWFTAKASSARIPAPPAA